VTTTCGCGQPAPDAYLCSRCTRQLRRTLADVPTLATELDTVLARATAYNDHHGGRSADKPLPIDERASEAAWVLRNTLTTWARILHDERGAELPATAHTSARLPLARPAVGEWTTEGAPTPQKGTQRCDQTDLPATSCHHCRSNP
jgi:hypothetical protein